MKAQNNKNRTQTLKIPALVLAMTACHIAPAQTWYIGTTNANSNTQEILWQAAVGGAPLENFDSYTVGTPFGNIATVGLTVRPYNDNTNAIVFNGGATFTRSGDQFLWNTSHIQTYFDANSPMTAFAYWAAGGDSDVHRVTLFDINNSVIGVNTVVAEPSLPCFLGVTTNVNIATVLIEAAGSGGTQDSLGFDDVQTNAVPEPATCLALAAGMVALVRRRRR